MKSAELSTKARQLKEDDKGVSQMRLVKEQLAVLA